MGLGLIITMSALLAQNPGIKRTVVEKQDISVPGREAVIAHVTLAPGATSGRHTHPGEEISYFLKGQADILVDGQPTKHVKPGDGFIIPAGATHEARNTGSEPAELAAIYVVEKGKPIATPAP